MANSNCIFCGIASGSVPATLIAQNESCVAFRDVAPKAPIHCLVIPRKHIGSLDAALSSGEAPLGDLLQLAAEVARSEGVAEGGYRVVINTNADGGQTVDHLHLHVLGGRALGWPPG